MRILVISRDASLLDPQSTASQRWRVLAKHGIELTAVVACSKTEVRTEGQIKIIGGGGGSISKYSRALRLAKTESKNCSLISAQDPFELGLIAWRVAFVSALPFEIQDHGGFFDGRPAYEPLWFLRKWIGWFLAPRANHIRTVSPGSFERLDKIFQQKKVYLLPLAADARFASTKRNPESGLIVSVSRLVSVKRLGLLLDGLVKLRQKDPTIRLALIGDGPDRVSLEARASLLGIRDGVEFVGQADPMPWLERASLFAMPSAHEGWGVAAVEAALARVPVLMTETGCARWLMNKNAAQVLPIEANADDWASKINEMLRASAIAPGLPDAPTIESVAARQAEVWKEVSRQKP